MAKLRDKGVPIDNVSNFDSSKEEAVFLEPVSAMNAEKLLFVTKKGSCKVTDGSEFDVSRRTISATKLLEGDKVLFVGAFDPAASIVFESEKEYFLRVAATDIPEKKKIAVGVKSMELSKGDELKHVYILPEETEMTADVGDHKVLLHRLKVSGRATKGSKR